MDMQGLPPEGQVYAEAFPGLRTLRGRRVRWMARRERDMDMQSMR